MTLSFNKNRVPEQEPKHLPRALFFYFGPFTLIGEFFWHLFLPRPPFIFPLRLRIDRTLFVFRSGPIVRASFLSLKSSIG